MNITVSVHHPMVRIRPSNADLRRMIRNKELAPERRQWAYNVLLYRKKHTRGR